MTLPITRVTILYHLVLKLLLLLSYDYTLAYHTCKVSSLKIGMMFSWLNFDIECRFHEIQPQKGLKMLPPGPSSRKIVSATPKSVPYPVLQENTLVLSNSLVVAKRNGKLSLMFRQACSTALIIPASRTPASAMCAACCHSYSEACCKWLH